MLLSGIALGFNWILLFESYIYTTVSTATLCYYMAPIIVIALSPVLFRERITKKKLLCIIAAMIGIVLVSGILQTGIHNVSELRGILFGLGAACFYASVVILNKKISGISALDRTLLQLRIAAILLLPYTLLTEDWGTLSLDVTGILLLAVAGILHTGIAYCLYFDSIRKLSAQTSALYSHIDPILAIVLSAVFLQEPLTVSGCISAVLILGAAFISGKE